MKKINLFLILFLTLVLIVPFVEPHFQEIHISAFTTIMNDPTWDSALKQMIMQNPDACYAGEALTDSSVIFYLTEEGRQKFYGGTHSIAYANNCMQLAGSDPQLKTFCECAIGHLVQDITSHGYLNYQGYTSLCISKYASTNIFLHSICERSVVNEVLADTSKFQYMPSAEEVKQKTCDAYDIAIIGDEDYAPTDPNHNKCTNKFAKIASEASGVDLCQAIHIVGSNLKQMCTDNQVAGSAYTDIYRSKQVSPLDYQWWLLGFFILDLLLIITNIMLGRTWWKWLVAFILIIILIILGILLYFAFFDLQSFYHFYNFVILDPLTNIINVPDWQDRVTQTIANTKAYLSDPNYQIPVSATGLNFYQDDKLIIGQLEKAQLTGQIVFWTFVIVGSALLIWLEIKVFKRKKQTRVI